MILELTSDEAQWLVDTIGALTQWPPEGAEWALGVVPADMQDEDACGPLFRLRLIQAAMSGAAVVPFGIAVQELWFLDAVLAQFFVRRTVTSTGRTLSELQDKVWRALLVCHAEQLPTLPDSSSVVDDVERYLKGGE